MITGGSGKGTFAIALECNVVVQNMTKTFLSAKQPNEDVIVSRHYLLDTRAMTGRRS